MVVSLFLFGAAAVAQSAEVIVNTPLGALSGTDEGDYLVFKGIRYAEPPQRFEVAEPKKPWNGTVSAQEFGDQCYFDKEPNGLFSMSEDCLFANVWAPPNADNLPVVVFIHGGGFFFGSGADRMYWGDVFVQDAERPVVYVTMNYRMGILGFYSDEEHGANFGFQDQQESLRWVRDNIAAFGGDPSSVTLTGQSAGAMSTQAHLVAPGSRGLFHRALLMSTVGLNYRSLSENEAFVKSAALAVGCDGIFRKRFKCMRERHPSVLSAAGLATGLAFHLFSSCDGCDNWLAWMPIVDGVTLPHTPLEMISAGNHAQVPVIASTNRNESFFFLPEAAYRVGNVAPLFDIGMEGLFRQNAGAVRAHYRSAPDSAGMHLVNRGALAVTDALFFCYSRKIARELTKTSPAFLSVFMHAPSEGLGFGGCHYEGATCHVADVAFTIPSSDTDKYEYTEQEKALAATYSGALKRFAYGDPSSWVGYSEDTDISTMWGDSGSSTTSGYHSDHCDFLESIGFPGWGSAASVVV